MALEALSLWPQELLLPIPPSPQEIAPLDVARGMRARRKYVRAYTYERLVLVFLLR